MDARLRWAIGVALGGIAVTVVSLWVPQREVHHALTVNVFDCRAAEEGARVCVASGRLSVGNTGNVDLGEVRVHFPAEAAEWRISTRVFDIRASAKTRARPVFSMQREAGAQVYSIRPLAENTVVDFECQCLRCPEEAVRALTAERIRIDSAGRVAKGDPRVATVARGLVSLLAALVP